MTQLVSHQFSCAVVLLLWSTFTVPCTAHSDVCTFMHESGFPNWTCNLDGCRWHKSAFSCSLHNINYLAAYVIHSNNLCPTQDCPSLYPSHISLVEIIFLLIGVVFLSIPFLPLFYTSASWRLTLLAFSITSIAILLEIIFYLFPNWEISPFSADISGFFSASTFLLFVLWAEPEFYYIEAFLFVIQMKAALSWGHFGGWEKQGRILGFGRFKGFNLDFFTFDCWYGMNVPFVVMAVLIVLWVIIITIGVAGSMYYNRKKLRDHIAPFIKRCTHTIVFITYVFYFPLVYHFLKRINCGLKNPSILVVVMLVLLVLVPLAFVVVGYHKRDLRTHPTTIIIFGFLYESFEFNFWWILSLFMGRKLVMVFIAAFTQYDPWMTYVLFISMSLVAYFKPFKSTVKFISFLSYQRHIEVGMGNLTDIAVCFWLLFSVMTPYFSFPILIVDIVGIFFFYVIFLWSARKKYLKIVKDSEHIVLLDGEISLDDYNES